MAQVYVQLQVLIHYHLTYTQQTHAYAMKQLHFSVCSVVVFQTLHMQRYNSAHAQYLGCHTYSTKWMGSIELITEIKSGPALCKSSWKCSGVCRTSRIVCRPCKLCMSFNSDNLLAENALYLITSSATGHIITHYWFYLH